MLKAGRLVGPRRRAFVLIAALVLGLHGVLLGGFDGGFETAPPRAPVVQVREVAALPAAAPAPAAAPRAVVTAAIAVKRPVPAAEGALKAAAAEAPVAAGEASSIEAMPAAAASAATVVSEPAASASTEPLAATIPEAAASSPVADTSPDAPPLYTTRLPPSVTLRYELQRGRLSGSGELRWELDGDRYALHLDGSVFGLPVLVQNSAGRIDAAGLAPQRFTDQRARRATQAANFQREAGKVSFSGASHEVPLRDGVQDRLSWMVQLAAIVAADPARRAPGATTVLQVIGARGDAGLWAFRCLGETRVETRSGPVDALHCVREPRGSHDTAVEVWLDPGRHHLPLRATLRNGEDGELLELRLRDATGG